ncbi:protein-tyrosine phosphatase family protein [Roseibium sp. M-1]
MLPSFYPVNIPTLGKLYLMPKPSGDWLEDDLARLREQGVDRIVSMLTAEEAEILGLDQEEANCNQIGLEFTSVPVPDRHVPGLEVVREIVASIVEDLSQGKGVSVHCRAGIGRSGLVVCCVLVALGINASDAIDTVSKSRGVAVPDTSEQRDFILSFRL